MANPRQRRKARSSSYRPVSHSLHAKKNLKKTTIRGPKVLQDAWDKTKTVRQNYANLGLVVTLDPSAHGGVEKALGEAAASSSSSSAEPAAVPSGFGRIVRDAEGNVVGVEMNEEEEKEAEPEEMDMEQELESRMDERVRAQWCKDFSRSTAASAGPVNAGVIHELETLGASATGSRTLSVPLSGVGQRHVAAGEVKYLERLVAKHGGDVEKMARDLKLNPEQRTVGQLGRALKRAGLV